MLIVTPIATVDSFAYRLFLLLHIGAVIFGFGGVVYSGIYAAKAMRKGPAAAAITSVNFEINRISEISIYLVPLFGFALVGLSDKAWKFSQTWVWLSLVLYVIGVGIAHAVLIPSHRKLVAALEAGGPEAGEVAPLRQRLGVFGGVSEVLLVVILVLMIWKPGT